MQSSCLPLLSQTPPKLRRSRWCGRVGAKEVEPENVIVPQPTKPTEDSLADTKSPQEILDEVYDNSPLPEPEPSDEEQCGLLYRASVLIVFIVYILIMYRMAAGPEL
jgi:hypothetical protein